MLRGEPGPTERMALMVQMAPLVLEVPPVWLEPLVRSGRLVRWVHSVRWACRVQTELMAGSERPELRVQPAQWA